MYKFQYIKFANYLLITLFVTIYHTIFSVSCVSASQENITENFELRQLDDEMFFVLSRSINTIYKITVNEDKFSIKTNIPVKYNFSDDKLIKKYTKNFQTNYDKQIMTFQINKLLTYNSIVNGEKFDAIRFKINKEEEKKEVTSEKKQIKANDSKKDQKKKIIKINEEKKQYINLTYQEQDNEQRLNFDFGKHIPRIATFKDQNNVFIIFDEHIKFALQQNPSFKKLNYIKTNDGTVIKFELNDKNRNVFFIKNKNGLTLVISDEKIDSNSFEIINEDNSTDFIIKHDFKNHKIVKFENDITHEEIYTIPVNIVNMGIKKDIDEIDFGTPVSTQGIIIKKYSDDVTINLTNDSLIISIADNYITNGTTKNDLKESIEEYAKLPTLLPIIDPKLLNVLNFNERRSVLLSNASSYENTQDIYNGYVELAQFYFMHELYHETISSISLAKKHSPDEYSKDLKTKFLQAVSYSMIKEYDEAEIIYYDLMQYTDIELLNEIKLWRDYNAFSLGFIKIDIGVYKNIHGFISLYYDDIYWKLVFAEIQNHLNKNEFKKIEKLLNNLRAPKKKHHINSLKYFTALYYNKIGQNNLGRNLLEELIHKKDDKLNYVRASFELLKIQHRNKKISDKKFIESLKQLQWYWRGDKLEYDILNQIAATHALNNDLIDAMRTYRYIDIAFSNIFDNLYITSRMSQIFSDIFVGDAGKNMDDFKIVALFYEFQNITPVGSQGDQVILSIIERLVRLDLLDKAINLLEHQVLYRLQDEEQVISANKLAILYILNQEPQKAIEILNETDFHNSNYKMHRKRVKLKARALIDMKEYDKVLEYLVNDYEVDARILKREALFKSQKWTQYVDEVHSQLDYLLKQVNEKEDRIALQDIIRLAIAYYNSSRHDELTKLKNNVQNNEDLKNIVELLDTNNMVVKPENIDKTLNIDQMQILIEQYRNEWM